MFWLFNIYKNKPASFRMLACIRKSRQPAVRKISVTRFELQTGSVILRPGKPESP